MEVAKPKLFCIHLVEKDLLQCVVVIAHQIWSNSFIAIYVPIHSHSHEP